MALFEFLNFMIQKGSRFFVGRKKVLDADIRLKQVFKPHTAAVTALAYDRDGEVLATGVRSRFPFVSY